MHDSERDRIFTEWLAGHKGILFKVVHAYAFEHADRQDLFQEIVIQVWRSVDAFRGESSVPTWMYRVALNTAIAWSYQRQARREQRFGESLREQLNRGIAQLDDRGTTARMTLVVVLLGGICPIALFLLIGRINGKSISDDGSMLVSTILMCAFGVATGVWSIRQQARDVVLPHKRRLEELLKELDGQ